MKTIKTILFSLFVLTILASCQSENRTKNTANINDSITIESTDSTNNQAAYKIPSPVDLFVSIQKYNIPYSSEILSDPDRQSQYLNKYSRGLNFGIYTTDLAYATVFGNNQDAISYFSASKELAEELGIYSGFGKGGTSRVDNNLQNLDSLLVISNDSYTSAITSLEEQGLNDMLALILAGGWIESAYIATQSIKEDGISSPAAELIADQHLLLENLVLFMKNTDESEDVVKVIVKFEELLEIYDDLHYNNEKKPITEDQLIEISNKISEIRNHFVFEI